MKMEENLPSNAYVGGESLRPLGPTGTILKLNPDGGGFPSWRLSNIARTSSFCSLRIVFMIFYLVLIVVLYLF